MHFDFEEEFTLKAEILKGAEVEPAWRRHYPGFAPQPGHLHYRTNPVKWSKPGWN